MDILIAAAALVALCPLLLVTAFAIALDSGRPVFFSQLRVGLGARNFRMLKFRSMVKNAEVIGPASTAAGDPRITRTGQFIRRTSIDELPQLVNVLKGEMSLVGPRPALPSQRGLYSDAEWQERCSVRPGITGLSQVLLRSEGSNAESTALDLRYVREHTVGFDFRILALTVGRISGRGSN